MLELEVALDRILSSFRPLGSEQVLLSDALNRVAATDVFSEIDLPPFDNSAMDGYAVRAADVSTATPDHSVSLELVGSVAAGEQSTHLVSASSCVRIFTGSPLPQGADAVVMQEDTLIAPGSPQQVIVLDAVKPWENVRFRGEDIKKGARILPRGERIRPSHLSLLAACGFGSALVARQPSIGIVPTGSELLSPGANLLPGQIFESNSVALAALARLAGSLVKIYPVVKDSLASTVSALKLAISECDVVITSGGVSVGEFDFVKLAWEQLGGSLQLWKVAIKPGKPFVWGTLGEKTLFGLPGNPVSALVTAFLLVRPALLRLQGANEVAPVRHPVILGEAIKNSGERRHFIRVHIDQQGFARSAGTQASHMLSSMAAANGLLDLPPRSTFQAGTQLTAIRWDI